MEGTLMPSKIYRRPAVQDLTGLSRSTLYKMILEDRFPAPVRLGARAVGWRETDLIAWIESRAKAD
jgi:prophage regulatory protein